ncbi:MAG: citrate synthase [Pyrinomonadaceae bacterium MAG19_C2-C3]|nr:citrate synthase [Pyrinomonadaceae bacterium MAG19_C2-C3]
METAKENSATDTAKTNTAKSPAGLEGVVAATSSIGDVDGINGILIYQGINVHDLAEHSTFEETVYLLWHGRLPKQDELNDFKTQLAAHQNPPAEVLEMMRHLPKDAVPMDILRTAVSALALYDNDCCDTTREGALRTATKLTAQLPVLVAASERIRKGEQVIAPKPELNIATNFLYMLRGTMPEEREARIFDVALILHADHELNASTFTSRVVAATLADMYGAVTAAIAALAGSLHGGANSEVMRMLLEVGDENKAQEWIKDALAQKKKIMGFGHRVYKTEDPRATWLRKFSEELGKSKGNSKWFEMSRKVEQTIMDEKKLYPNVDFYSASTYYMMDIPLDLFTPIFAVSRISGWTGHILEQYANNRLIRPRAEYTGGRDVPYTPIEKR